MEARSIEELMIPLADYAVVPRNATLVDAVRKLKAVGRRLVPARQAARAVLVVDTQGRVIGQLGHLEILQGLQSEYGLLGDSNVLSRAGVSEELLGSLAENLSFWRGDLEDACQRARSTKVSELMRPIEESVTVDAPLSEAIHRIVMWQRPRILVTKGERVVGVLRLADLFDAVSDILDAGDARPASNDRLSDGASDGPEGSRSGAD